ncbi:MAG: acylphosphatase [Candidatus Omnitrophota bacterium]|nr:MAG: acylphosphatase [Candidatus Omnitrophota bacterium]HDN97703.1 acylphosphatase [bacterium]
MKRYHLFVSGIVQGVGFRWYTQRIARANNICGWVKNLPDGRVEIIAEGDEKDMDNFLKQLKEGHLGRNIEKIDKYEEEYEGKYTDFSIVF